MDSSPNVGIALLAAYSVLILLASLAGGWIPLLVRLTHTRLQVATSFVAGLMLGVGVLHLLPHAYHQMGSIDRVAVWLLVGFLLMFFLQRFFHFHHHDVPEENLAPGHVPADHAHHDHGHDHGHAHEHSDSPPGEHEHTEHCLEHTLAAQSAGKLSWSGAAFGLTLHTIIDGIALAASVEAEAHGGVHGGLLGLGTFLVIILHKPFDSMAIGTLMAAGGWSKTARHIVNGLFAMAIPLGVLLFHFGAGQYSGTDNVFVGGALAFAAGTFLCIAASDLLPELQFHSHDRGKLSISLLAGLALAVLIGRFETSGHDRHEHGPVPAIEQPKH